MGQILHLGLLFFVIIPLIWADRLPCDNTERCSCVQHASEKNEYWCGVNRTDGEVIIEVRPNIGVKVICSGLKDASYLDMLKGIRSTRNLHRFSLKQCAIPDRPFEDVLKILDVEPVGEICIDLSHDAAVNINPSHFQNLGTLEKLYLWNNNIAELPEYVFKDLANLKRLYLNGNQLQILPNKIFEPLGKLEWLDLGFNNLTALDGQVLQHLTKLKYLNLYKNRLDNVSKSLFASLTQLTSLDLSNNNMTRLKEGIFDNLAKLEDLNLNYNNLTRIPDKLFVNNRQLKFIRLMAAFNGQMTTLPEALFARMTELEAVFMDSNNLTTLPKDLFRECADLKMVSLRKNSLRVLPSNLFKDTKNLEELDLSNNNLESLDDALFNPLKKLKKLKLDRNRLTNIASNLLANLKYLTHLDLSRNQLVDFEDNTFADLTNLTKINLSHNKLTMDRAMSIGASPFNKCTNLQSLNLTNNLLTMVFEDWRNTMTKLKSLDISYNELDSLTTADFMFTSANYPVTVNFSNNRIKTIDLYALESHVKSQCEPFPCSETSLRNRGLIEFTMENNPIKCDCDAYHLARYYQNKMSPVVNQFVSLLPHQVNCHWPEMLKNVSLKEVDLNELKCPLSEVSKMQSQICPSNCSCYYRPAGHTIIINCTGIGMDRFPERIPAMDNSNVELLFGGNRLKSLDGLSNLSKMATVTRLTMSFNKLKSIDDFVLPRGLKILELDNNEITSLSNRTITHLISSANLTTLTLHKNPWDCDCETKYFLNFIRNQYKKIPNYQDIQCKENGHSVITLTEDDLCYISFTIILTCISLAIFGLVSGAVMALYYMYEHEIKVWMFAHKICLWLVAEKEIDKDKIYDAFISFSHKDQEFVDKHLIPQLEKNNDHNYKLCIHYRDFIVGEFIPSQIVYSVENSRRTIIVLTTNFLESVWGRMEFRTAHLQAIKEGCARVIIVMLEDVSNEKLDPELRAYITMNTYVKWGDPLFWEKLKYALPHPQSYVKRSANVAPLSEAELKKQQKLFNLDEIIRSKA